MTRHRSAGEPVTFVDTSTLLGPGDVADGLHPAASGYRKTRRCGNARSGRS